MRQAVICRDCGRPIPSAPGIPAAGCPFCLVNQALSESDSGPSKSVPKAASTSPPAERFGKYGRLAKLGSGGMGEVWKAWDSDLERWVALKLLRHDDPREVERFTREARTAAALSHPHIAAVYESGAIDGKPYIAMQLIEGRTLAEWPRSDRRRLVGLIRDAARAVGFAHRHGIIHRDLKPTNLMASESEAEPRVMVMDFGLARRIHGAAKLSRTGTLAGTPLYMSPEQARGRRVDSRTDVYSLGATLYELLTGRTPFVSNDPAELLQQIVSAEPPSLRSLNRSIPRDLETIVLKCLEKDPERRYRSAETFAGDLDRWLTGEPILARPSGPIYRWGRKLARRKAILAATAASLALAMFFFWWNSVGAPAERSKLDLIAGMKAWLDLVPKSYGDDVDEPILGRLAAEVRAIFERSNAALESGDAHAYRGRCLLLEKNWSEAMKAFERALEVDPSCAEARLEMSKQLLLHYWQLRGTPKIKSINAGNPELAPMRPENEHESGARRRAMELLSGGAIPKEKHDLLNGLLAMGRSKFEEAATHLARHVKSDPLDAQAFLLQGTSLIYSGKFREAMGPFRRSMNLVNYHQPHYELGWIHYQSGEYAESIRECTAALKLNPTHGPSFYIRGNAYIALNDVNRSIEDFGHGTRADPQDADLFYNYGTSLGRYKQDFEGADKALTEAIRLNPGHALALCNRGIARGNLGRLEEALKDFDRALELIPGDLKFLMNRGTYRGKAKKHEGAMRDFMEVVKLLPKESRDHRTYCENVFAGAMWLHQTGHYKAAIDGFQFLSGASSIEIQRINSAFNVACGYALLGEPSLALDWLAKSIELGWKDISHIEKDKDLDALRDEPRYKSIMEELKRKAEGR